MEENLYTKRSNTFNFEQQKFMNVYEQMRMKIHVLPPSTPIPSIWFEQKSI
jgi:hypothetical protein